MSERHSDTPGAPGPGGSVRPEVEPQGEDLLAAESASAPTSTEGTAALLKELRVGTVVDGKYRIDEVIGRGAMGVVLGATHVHLKERLALKFLSTRPHGQSDDFHSRFRREAIVSAKLRNEHITRVTDVGMWRDQLPFMVMDLLIGDDLRRTLKQAPGGRIPPALAIDYAVQICEGLAEAHSHGIVHRDLKPSNLFVTKRQDGTDLIKILDFGISKWSSHEEQLEELTQTGVVLGSPKYMSPEQLFGSASVDARADVWSIGAILYEMLTGRPPFDFPTLTRICAELAADNPPPSMKSFDPELPDVLEGVVMRCFVRDREHRVQNVAELAGTILDAIEAPFAAQVRQRIVTMLDPKGQAVTVSTVSSSGALSLSTSYRSATLTGSTPRMSSSGALRLRTEPIPPSAATAGGVESLVLAEAAGAGRKKILLVAVLSAAIVAVLAFAFAAGHPRTIGSNPSPPAASSVSVAAQTPTPSVPATPSPVVAASAPSASATPNAALAPVPSPPVAPRGHFGHRGVVVRPSTPAPPIATAAPPSPVTPPTVAPAPAPAPTKANPLEDRQ